MKHLLLLGGILLISGCSQPNMTTIYPEDKQMVLKDRAVDLPMPFYDLSMKSQDYPRCHKKGFCALFPEFRDSDFIKMNHPWNMIAHENGYSIGIEQTFPNGAIVLDYSIQFFSSISPYDARARAVEYKDKQYILTSPTTQYGKDKYGKEGNVNVHYETHGKENYTCLVSERADKTLGMKGIGFNCYKFNPERTMAKNVVIRLTYTRIPNLPQELEPLANEYTYEDLQQRSQRILDSLYIKDGWEK